jgi:hypothetical protein
VQAGIEQEVSLEQSARIGEDCLDFRWHHCTFLRLQAMPAQ